jgi:exosortase C (VPDSG-CTERM-specific)
MNNPNQSNPAKEAIPMGMAPGAEMAAPLRKLLMYLLVLSVCFIWPLFGLVRYSLKSEFFSYIPLIPFISLYLVSLKVPELPRLPGLSKAITRTGICIAAAVAVAWVLGRRHGSPSGSLLTLTTTLYVILVAAGCVIFLGAETCRRLIFPIAFLAFMIPMPDRMLEQIELFFQQTSAVTAVAFLNLAGMPVLRNDLVLNLPGYHLIIAPECSGIHSTMVLLITAFLAGHLFLRSGWKRAFLVVLVVPLAILRNGFRIFVISELCVQISHDMINSWIHRRGGPIFFALSLIPFFVVLLLLRKSELRDLKTAGTTGKS